MFFLNREFFRFYTLFFCLIFIVEIVIGQNNCNVKADFLPKDDTVFANYANVQLKNTSSNATDFQFFINGVGFGRGKEFSYPVEVELMEIKLVAYNGNCTDTAVRYIFYSGTRPSDFHRTTQFIGLSNGQHYPSALTALKSGGYLVAGYIENYKGVSFKSSILAKLDEWGCIKWSKLMVAPFAEIYWLKELANGDYLVSGYSDGERFLTRFDVDGNVIWSKQYIINPLPIQAKMIQESPNGDIYIVGETTNP